MHNCEPQEFGVDHCGRSVQTSIVAKGIFIAPILVLHTYLLTRNPDDLGSSTVAFSQKRFHNRNRCRRLACIAYQRIEHLHLRPRLTRAITRDKVIGTKPMTKGHWDNEPPGESGPRPDTADWCGCSEGSLGTGPPALRGGWYSIHQQSRPFKRGLTEGKYPLFKAAVIGCRSQLRNGIRHCREKGATTASTGC